MPPLTEPQLRWRWERPVTALYVIWGVAVLAAAATVLLMGAEGIRERPEIAGQIEETRTAAIAVLLAVPLLGLMRSARRRRLRANAIRVTRDQLPELHALLDEQCQRLGVTPIPALYLSSAPNESVAVSGPGQNYIILAVKEAGGLPDRMDVVPFFLGRQVGAISLGHAAWWIEFLLSLVLRVPLVGAPLKSAWGRSEDRCGAFLAPDGALAFAFLAVGGTVMKGVDLDAFVRDIREQRFWDRTFTFWGRAPAIAKRVRALEKAGLLGAPR